MPVVVYFVSAVAVCLLAMSGFAADLPATAPVPAATPAPKTAPAPVTQPATNTAPTPPTAIPTPVTPTGPATNQVSVIPPVTAPPPPPAAASQAPTPAHNDLRALIAKIQLKLNQGARLEVHFQDEIKEFDTLLAKYKAEKTDDVAQILFMKAMLYVQVFGEYGRALSMFKQVKTDFPGTRFANGVDPIIAQIEQIETMKKIEASLVVGSKFPDFEETDIMGKPMSTAKLRGKVVLVDFWATWCGPCLQELPYVLSTYQKYHPKGFEILGISFDKELPALENFVKTQNIPWQQFFDLGANNKLALKYGAMSIPTTYLLDAEGKIIAKSLRGEQLEQAVEAALLKK